MKSVLRFGLVLVSMLTGAYPALAQDDDATLSPEERVKVEKRAIGRIPILSGLSFVFLAFFSHRMAIVFLSPVARTRRGLHLLGTTRIEHHPFTVLLGAILMTMLDVVIDPLTLQGHRWFLGQIYYYDEVGVYFGVPIANFIGWLFTGMVLILAWCLIDHILNRSSRPGRAGRARR